MMTCWVRFYRFDLCYYLSDMYYGFRDMSYNLNGLETLLSDYNVYNGVGSRIGFHGKAIILRCLPCPKLRG